MTLLLLFISYAIVLSVVLVRVGAMRGQEAVLSALGHKRFFYPTRILSEGTRNILRSMETHGVVIVRPGVLTNGDKRGWSRHGRHVGSFLLTVRISRADVADFMLSQLASDTYLRTASGAVDSSYYPVAAPGPVENTLHSSAHTGYIGEASTIGREKGRLS